MQLNTGERVQPRMSAAKMGEYLDASAHRRERILRDQKFPPVYKTVRYENARRAIQTALTEGGDVAARLVDFVRRAEGQLAGTAYQADSNRCCVDAVRRFAALFGALALDDITATRASGASLIVHVEGVGISVAPAALLQRTGRNGDLQVGALIPVFRKEQGLGIRGGKAVAELLRRALVETGQSVVQADLCIVVDVFSGDVTRASKRYRRITDEIAAACREIAVRWPSLRASKAA